MNKVTLRTVSIIFLAWTADFITKYFAVINLSDFKSVSILGDFLKFRLVYNTGGVFGIFQGNALVFQILTGFAIIFLFVYYLKSPQQDKFFNFAIAFVLGGALGNFTDRFFRTGVVDFVDMGLGNFRWPTYNVADMFISFGGVLLIISFYYAEKKHSTKSRKHG
jgi:signal peptidase II